METIDVPPNGKTIPEDAVGNFVGGLPPTDSVEVVPPIVVQAPLGTTVTTDIPTKSILLSKTALGVAVAGFCTALQVLGIANVSDAVQGNIVDIIVAVANIAGLIYALYGRWVAKHQIV